MNRTGLFSRIAAGTVAVAVAATMAACSSSGGKKAASGGGSSSSAGGGSSSQPGKGKPAITMGDKNFAEEYLLGELYSQALKAKGYTVTLKGNIGVLGRHRQGPDQRPDRHVPRVHRRHLHRARQAR